MAQWKVSVQLLVLWKKRVLEVWPSCWKERDQNCKSEGWYDFAQQSLFFTFIFKLRNFNVWFLFHERASSILRATCSVLVPIFSTLFPLLSRVLPFFLFHSSSFYLSLRSSLDSSVAFLIGLLFVVLDFAPFFSLLFSICFPKKAFLFQWNRTFFSYFLDFKRNCAMMELAQYS